MDFRRHPELRILRLDALAKRMEARWRLLMERRSPHAFCMATRYSWFELAGEALAMHAVGPYRDAT